MTGSARERLTGGLATLRERRPSVNHLFRTLQHYQDRDGNAQAGSVTFFGFLSFFPILALAFFLVGYVSAVFPAVRGELLDLLDEVLPGLVGNGDGEIPLTTFEEYGKTVGAIGLVALVYSGLAWVAGMRTALQVMFVLPRRQPANIVLGKAKDLGTMLVLGVVLLVSVSLSGAMAWFSEQILGWVGLDESWMAVVALWVITHGLGIGTSSVLLVVLFRLIARPDIASTALWRGSLAGAVGFEVLKSAAGFLLTLTERGPAFQAFGVTLILLVWINYFSRLVMLSASWAHTAPLAEHIRDLERRPLVAPDEAESAMPAPAVVVPENHEDEPVAVPPWSRTAGVFGAGVVAGGGVVAALMSLGRRSRH